jgi:hypothetical protein
MNNGHSAMFEGYRKALDAMMVYSYNRLTKVKAGEGSLILPSHSSALWLSTQT